MALTQSAIETDKIPRLEFTPTPSAFASYLKLKRAIEERDRGLTCKTARLLTLAISFAEDHMESFVANGKASSHRPSSSRGRKK